MSDLVTQTDGKTTRKVTASTIGATASPFVTALVTYALAKIDPALATLEIVLPIAAVISGAMAWAAGWITKERARFGL